MHPSTLTSIKTVSLQSPLTSTSRVVSTHVHNFMHTIFLPCRRDSDHARLHKYKLLYFRFLNGLKLHPHLHDTE